MIDIAKTLDEKGFGKGWVKKSWLVKKYWGEGLSMGKIAKLMNRSRSSVRWLMQKFNIKRRKQSSSPILFKKGKDHPHWNGGSERYWGRIARKVWEKYWREKKPKGYLIHHGDRNIKNNNICNLALLTVSFHAGLHNKQRGGKR